MATILVSGEYGFSGAKKLEAAMAAFESLRYTEFMFVEQWVPTKSIARVEVELDAPADCADYVHEAFVGAAKHAKHGFVDLREGETLRRVYAGGHMLRWDAAQREAGTMLGAQPGLEAAVSCQSPDGSLEAVALYARRESRVASLANARKYNDVRKTSVVLREPGSADEARRLFGPFEKCNGLCFSADGEFVIGGSADTYLYVWSASTGELVKKTKGHKKGVSAICLGDDGRLWSAGHDNRLKLWALPKLKAEGEVPVPFVPSQLTLDGDKVRASETRYDGSLNSVTLGLAGEDEPAPLDGAAFLKAISKEKLDEVTRLLEGDPRYAALMPPGQHAPLTLAVTRSKKGLELTSLLLLHGANPNDAGEERPPLHEATRHPKHAKALCALLLEHGANIDRVDFEGATALTHCRDEAVLHFLLKKGARPTGIDLKYAYSDDSRRELMLAANPNFDTLHSFWMMESLEPAMRAQFVALGAPLFRKDPEHEGYFLAGPCHLAAEEGDVELMALALDGGANPNQPYHTGFALRRGMLPPGSTLLDIAEKAKSTACAELLRNHGATKGTRTAYAVMSKGEPLDLGKLKVVLGELGVESERVEDMATRLARQDLELMRFSDKATAQDAAKRLAVGVKTVVA